MSVTLRGLTESVYSAALHSNCHDVLICVNKKHPPSGSLTIAGNKYGAAKRLIFSTKVEIVMTFASGRTVGKCK